MKSIDDSIKVKRIRFIKKLVELGLAESISTLEDQWSIHADYDPSANMIFYKLRSLMFHGEKKDKETYSHPKTWWDAFKVEWLYKKNNFIFKWISKKLKPAEFTTIGIDVLYTRYCPHIKAPNDYHVEFLSFGDFDNKKFVCNDPRNDEEYCFTHECGAHEHCRKSTCPHCNLSEKDYRRINKSVVEYKK